MSAPALLRVLGGYALVLLVACIGVRAWVSLATPSAPVVVVSRWKAGALVSRTTRDAPGQQDPREEGVTVVEEVVTGEGPLSLAKPVLALGLVSGRDGVRGELGGKVAWVTADDLLAAQAYDRASSFLDPSLGLGTYRPIVIHLLASRLGVTASEVEQHARVRRVRFERRVVGQPAERRITAETLDRATVTEGVRQAARYLARNVDGEGRYRYLVEATTGATLPGYNWPRHAGTTYFLAQAAALLDDADVRYACLRAAARLRDVTTTDCGEHRCIADDAEASVGSNALALLAFSEIVRSGADASYRRPVADLARFLRAQQRPDGELMHFYDRVAKKAVDQQVMYFTGEAAFALGRAHRITGDPADLRAASAALAHLSHHGWTFFGSRYYFAEEHWTCQAMAELWDRARDEEALAFCLRWHEYQRRLQHDDGDSPFDGDGSFGFGPLVTPRVTPASSRGEAAVAALDVVKRELAAGAGTADRRTAQLLEGELAHALAFVMRSQLAPGPRHVFARPELVAGALPGSAVDMQLRIDYTQHAGSMMVRWLEVVATPAGP